MAIIGLVVTGVKQATEHAYDANITQVEETLNIVSSDTLTIKMIGHDDYNKYIHKYYHEYKIGPK